MTIAGKPRGYNKLLEIPITVETAQASRQRLPRWLYRPLPKASEGSVIAHIKQELRSQGLSSVCEEASCPNLPECFSKGAATFMIMGSICTRRCSFCDVTHGAPLALDQDEPRKLAETIRKMKLRYVVITSVDRDDLTDGGAEHFAHCIRETRALNPNIRVEILTPDFRGKDALPAALDQLTRTAPDVFNHNLETVPRLYKTVRPGARYEGSLLLLKEYKAKNPAVLTKSGLMLGLGETLAEVVDVLKDLRAHDVEMLTLGQYLQPSPHHIAVDRFVHPDEFQQLANIATELGFTHVASGPNVRSSYHADVQFQGSSSCA